MLFYIKSYLITFVLCLKVHAEIISELFTVIEDRVASGDTALSSSGYVKTITACSILCHSKQMECFGANAVKLGNGIIQCDLFGKVIQDFNLLSPSDGNMYLHPRHAGHFYVPPALPGLTSTCSWCICKEMGCEPRIGTCNPDETACGPYFIGRPYWCDALGVSPCDESGQQQYVTCSKDLTCAQSLFLNYMTRFKTEAESCLGGPPAGCYQFTLVHFAGPWSCGSPAAWATDPADNVQDCCNKHGGC